ncbi:hypothetical protein EG68_11327 [Paragonimus skrjabini miyazakii]|uniref:Uncharacterized protein n=1 Tax=Paragonimus skrjabini miyazakii TaxID=59628 RepID=A0A8S9YDK8_9TREM|nr:hypothetical protein EG68_11327 [Paragonimus skrjabini miyazakii]
MCYSGSVENHVKQSNGGESDIMNHYATSYKSSYGQHWEHFRSRNPSLYGSGYTANIRPVVQYSPILDDIDNKRMRQLLKSNYFSVTHSDFLPFALQSGKEKIPNLTKFKLPKKYGAQIHKIHDSMMNVGLPSITGTGKPPTFSKDHHFLLADCGDPQMQTSYGSNYTKPKTHRYDIARIAMGPKEQTGSTRNNPTEETLTGRPVSPHFGSSFRLKTDRPLGTTHYSDNYIPYNTSDGKESFSKWMGPSVNQEQTSHLKQMKLWPDRVPDQSSNVYTRPEHMSEETLEKLKKTDPAEYQNVIHGFKDPR